MAGPQRRSRDASRLMSKIPSSLLAQAHLAVAGRSRSAFLQRRATQPNAGDSNPSGSATDFKYVGGPDPADAEFEVRAAFSAVSREARTRPH